jgi:uncharacterized protein
MKYEWDNYKNEINKQKHGFSFEEAKQIFDDPLHIAILDERFNYFEERWITIGKTLKYEVVVAAHLYFDDDGEEIIRIFSARRATSHERRQYEGKRR